MDRFETRSLGALGVEVVGLDLRGDVGEAVFSELRSLVVEEGFVLFRDQPLERTEQIALGERFGTLENLDPDEASSAPGLVVIGNLDSDGHVLSADSPFMKLISINEGWHTDSSFRAVPASFSLFSAIIVPSEGGDTFYASLERGWQALSFEEQKSLYGLEGVHDYASAYRRRGNRHGGIVGFNEKPIRHPLVRAHPESGKAMLYVSEHVASVDGWSSVKSQKLLDRLLDVTTHEDRVYRHHWRAGDLAIWDNRSMLHRAQGFDGRHARVMHHVRVAGMVPPLAARPQIS